MTSIKDILKQPSIGKSKGLARIRKPVKGKIVKFSPTKEKRKIKNISIKKIQIKKLKVKKRTKVEKIQKFRPKKKLPVAKRKIQITKPQIKKIRKVAIKPKIKLIKKKPKKIIVEHKPRRKKPARRAKGAKIKQILKNETSRKEVVNSVFDNL